MKFRKKPVVIDAIQYLGDKNKFNVAEFFKGGGEFSMEIHEDFLLIHTLEGTMRVDKNDWVIKGVKGEFYPCKPDIFTLTYEKAEQ